MPSTTLHVPVGQVTLDASFVAETIARIWEVEERIMAFNGRGADATPMSEFVSAIGEDIYRASFPIENDEHGCIVGLWQDLIDRAQDRAGEELDVR